jgi:rhodanese-related sulfurtransferase
MITSTEKLEGYGAMTPRVLLMTTMLLGTACITARADAYDEALAAKYHQTMSKLDQAGLVKLASKNTASSVLRMIARKEKFTLLDIRTPAEISVVGLTIENSLHIPMDELFRPENLAHLPTDRPIIVVCRSGVRAASATALLQSLGFTEAVALKDGLIGLATELSPMTAPPVEQVMGK